MNQLTASRPRIYAIDVLRGLVMIIMALDHVRDFFHKDAMLHDPLDLQTTSPVLFFTRWITHFCAPVFVLLSGTSAYLAGRRKGRQEQGAFLVKRGLWLVIMEITVITLALTFNPRFNPTILQVIWAIGISMVVLGILVRFFSWKVILALGLLIVFGHNLLDGPEAARGQQVGFWWDLLHYGRFSTYPIGEAHQLVIAYAFVPWTGIMLAGYGLGRVFEPDIQVLRRNRILVWTGAGLILLFVLVRWTNAYGNPSPWSLQPDGMRTLLSFINVHKYPPSMLYACITIGPSLLLLPLLENSRSRFTEVCRVFGSVPFFYYVVHFYLIHLLTVLAFFATGYGAEDIVTPNMPFLFRPVDFGFPLGTVYLIWMGLIILLYPVCRWYARYKSTHRQWWLSYI